MGWLYMQSLGGHYGPRQYVDAQFTFTRPDLTSKVLRSALVGMRVYYAAIEHVRHETHGSEDHAFVCLVTNMLDGRIIDAHADERGAQHL